MMTTRMPRTTYDAIDAVNWSTLKNMQRSPAHYRAALMQKPEDTDAMRLGRVTHIATFEPERFKRDVAIWDGGRRAGNAWDAWQEANRGLELINSKEADQCMRIAEAARAAAGSLLAKGKAELSLQWTHPNGLDAKGRIDFLSSEHGVVDLKTCRDAGARGFGSAAARLGYVTQAAYYVDALEILGQGAVGYTIVAVEKIYPYVSAIYSVTPEQLAEGSETYRELLGLVKHCREENHWPGYPPQTLQLPKWAQPFEEDDDGMGLEGLDDG